MKEVWKDIPGLDGIYQASDFGRIKRMYRVITNKRGHKLTIKELIIKQFMGCWGYPLVPLTVNGKQKSISVHRLVGRAFLPNPDGLRDINHKDFNKANNHVSNLEWLSHSANVKYSYDFGNVKRRVGELNGRARLTEAQVVHIRKRELSYNGYVKLYGVGKSTVHGIVTGQTWKHI